MRFLFGVLGVAFLMSMSSRVSVAADPPIKVRAKDLLTEYTAEKEPEPKKKETDPKKKEPDKKEPEPKKKTPTNPGDEKYKGKIVEVTGVMRGKIAGSTITLEGGTAFKVTVGCAFGTQDKEKLLALEKAKTLKEGLTITIRGTCNGLTGAQVKLDDCVLIDPPFPKDKQ